MTAHAQRLSMAVIALAVACGDRDSTPTPRRDPQPPRRVIEPPTGTVRPLPPYTIKPEGVGPYYTLNQTISSLLQQLPSGPRITRFEIPGVVRTNVIRAEDDTVLIGGETNGTPQFIAVVGPEVARTESGIKVGSHVRDLVQELGPVVEEPERVRDPRLVCVASLKNVRVIVENEKIAAFVVGVDTPALARKDAPECNRPRPPTPNSEDNSKRVFGACLTGGAGELVEISDSELAIYAAGDRKLLSTLRIPNLVFAGALRNATENRDELVVVTRTDTPQLRTWAMGAYRVEGAKLIRVVDTETVYSLTSSQARWIGAELSNVDLYLEIAHRTDGIEVGGLLTSWRGDSIRDVAVVSPVVTTRRSASGKLSLPDAGSSTNVHDAGVPADAASEATSQPGSGSAAR